MTLQRQQELGLMKMVRHTTKSSERGSRFAFTSNADIDEKLSQGDIIKQLKPALDDAGRNMLLTGANNARLAESFKELGSGDLTAVNDSINQDGGDFLEHH